MDGEIYSQSHAILRLLGSQFGYYPSDPVEGWKVDSIIDYNHDLISAFKALAQDVYVMKEHEDIN